MLQIQIPVTQEYWDEENEVFIPPKVKILQLEHSLVSLSKWESKWHKAFLAQREKTSEEILDYIKCMTLTRNVDQEVYNHVTKENVKQIIDYIYNPMTATHMRDDENGKKSRDVVTSELIYYWMIALNVPVEFEKWHLNRLMTLIKVCKIKSEPEKNRPRGDVIRDYAALNEARRKELNSKG